MAELALAIDSQETMYLDHFQLTEQPFTLAPNPKYLYYSDSHKEGLSRMIYAITQESGFMVLVGEVGTGKTLLINALLSTLPKNYHAVNIHYTALRPKGLIQSICKEFGLNFGNQTMAELIFKLQTHFQAQYEAGKKSVLIVDEAQNLSRDSLEIIRLLTNLQSEKAKYVQVLLVGQPELNDRLAAKDLRQLRQRVALKYELIALNAPEVANYIAHRLAVAGNEKLGSNFSNGALKRIKELTGGVPRSINILCDNLLIWGYSQELDRFATEDIEMVAETPELTVTPEQPLEVEIAEAAPDNTALPPAGINAINDMIREEVNQAFRSFLQHKNVYILRKPSLPYLLVILAGLLAVIAGAFLLVLQIALRLGLLGR